MSKIIVGSIDLQKIDKSRIVTKDKNGNEFKNGAKYYNITIILNDEKDKYDNDVSIQQGQTKEERENKTPVVYLGNAKTIYEKAPNNPKSPIKVPKGNDDDGWGSAGKPKYEEINDPQLPF